MFEEVLKLCVNWIITVRYMNIFALRGKGASGKSSTIRILHNFLKENSYAVIDTNINPQGGDFRTIFARNGKRVGITSSGDTFDLVYDNLEFLISSGCTICVCACRTYDRYGHGSNAAIDSFTAFEKEYVDKTLSSDDQHETSNRSDAQELFNRINPLL